MSKHDKHKFRRSEFNGLCNFLNTAGEYCREEEGHPCHVSGKALNAAESLPADWRGFVESLREVPPVEAKEKERIELVCNKCGRKVGVGGSIKEGNGCNIGTNGGYRCAGIFESKVRHSNEFGAVAEPKPTPSTQPESELYIAANNAYSAMAGNNSPFDPEVWSKAVLDLEWAIANYKSQPDSSSIPDVELVCLNCERSYGDHWGPQNHCREGGEETWRYVHPSALPDSAYDSSSISTEQTFEDWWNKVGNDQFGQSVYEDIAQEIWNAAKGQSNDR